MAGVIHVKDDDNWKAVNFNGAKVWVKDAGVWKEPVGVYVKHSGTWKLVYPSTSESWTTSNRPTSVDRKTTSDPPNLTTDPSYQYTNLLSANSPVYWTGRASGNTGQWVRGWDFGWSPGSTAGFGYGAVSRIEITFRAGAFYVVESGKIFRIETKPRQGIAVQTANLTTDLTTYTFDKSVSAWGLTAEEAGALHTSPSSADSIEVNAYYDNATGAVQDIGLRDLKCRIKYYHN